MTDSGTADLISRAWVLAEYDRQHQGPPGGARKIIAEAPTIDAIPVEWLKTQESSYTGDVSDIGKSVRNGTIKDLIRKWHKEQEAR